MSIEAHGTAMNFYAEAEAARRAGDAEASRRLLLKAAQLEVEAFESIPPDRSRTRGIVAVSAVSLFAQAGETTKANNLAARFLYEGQLAEEHRRELLDALVDSEQQRHAADRGLVTAPHLFDVSLRGATVGVGGIIPLETVLLKLQQFRNYLLRIGEYVSEQPFRLPGAEQDEALRTFTPLLSPATVGSYRFQIGLEGHTEQLQLSGGPTFDTDRIANEAFQILAIAADGPEFLEDRVTDHDYADWFTKAVRNIAPTGKGLEQVEVARRETHDAAILVPEARKRLDRHIRSVRRSVRRQAPPVEEIELVGVLRALHLNQRWLLLVQDGREVRCEIGEGVWDDVVGPLVNHDVRVTARRRGTSLEALDIAEAD